MEDTVSLNDRQLLPRVVESSKNPPLNVTKDYDNSTTTWRDIKPQVISSIVIALALSHSGLSVAFTNLLENNTAKTNFATTTALITPFGSVLLNITTDRLGRKRCLIFLLFLCVVSWLLLSFSEQCNPVFYAGSVIGGITRGALTAHTSNYISEITNGYYRQLFLSFTTVFFSFGFLLVGIFDLITSWKTAALCSSFLFIFEMILVQLLVWESPQWHGVLKENLTKAEWVLKKYNPKPELFEKERTGLHAKIASMTTQINDGRPSVFRIIFKSKVYRPSFILIILLLYQQFCGIYPLAAYTNNVICYIVPKFQGKTTSYVLLTTGITRLLISIVSTIFLKKFNQKQLMIVSAIGMLLPSIPIVILKACVVSNPNEIEWSDWISVSCFVAYITLGCMGINGIPWTLIFELLPTEVRGTLGPYFVGFGYLIMAGLLSKYLEIYEVLDTIYVFSILCMLNFLGILFIYFAVPETRGKTLYDVEKNYSKNKSVR